jgi:hypothetical protein
MNVQNNLWLTAPTFHEINLYEMPVTLDTAYTRISKQWYNSSPLATHLQNAGTHFFPLVPQVRWSEYSDVGVPPGHLPHQLYPPDWSPDHLPLQIYITVLPTHMKRHNMSENHPTSKLTETVTEHDTNNQLPPENSTKQGPSSGSTRFSPSQQIPPVEVKGYWFLACGFLHNMWSEFTDDISETTVGPIVIGHVKKNNQISRLLPYIQVLSCLWLESMIYSGN